MAFTLPLDKMTISEKLAAMELLWADLSHLNENVPPFSWHGRILKDREKLISQDKASFSNLNEARQRIQEKTQ
jgi:hypothetical protein